MARKRLGETLVGMGIIDQATLDKALAMQKGSSRRLGQVLEDMDVLLEEDIARALAKQFGFRYAKGLARFRFSPDVLNLIDPETVLSKLIFPLKIDGKTLHLAMVNPLDIELQDDIAFKTGLNVAACVTSPEEIKAGLRTSYMVDVSGKEEKDRHWSVLIIDDQEIVLNAAEAALKKEGYTIYKAENGAEGLKTALQLRPHVILTDVLMPRMGGMEFFRVLRSNSNIADTPVIALSAKATPEAEYELLDMGFFDFVPKPINPIRLAARVKRAMRVVYSAAR
ncbi:Type II secretion system (T2SS), protein E, N-terminal domain [Malonomonas rubra DSM 5091]|uniref:Type II secretion system (T2SS), protein E, N-terminal domain n=1 Tax=Malonomonas rubra DSM 5091 TaxID=1122189 RepID=A0A1M6CKT2_MALRU|nr:response regulator [Malonomonas rubra]SHI61569.1 Type II secretion system (T2SS), protein E, N-terminal domain [Malonomonas rubra DSM 5091]